MTGSADPGATTAVAIPVDTPSGSYVVHLGRGVCARAGELLPAFEAARAAAVVAAPGLEVPADLLAAAFEGRGIAVRRLVVPAGEDAKRLAVVEELYQQLAALAMHPPDPLVAVGGGATTDVVGFAAATWLRGVPLVNVPTTVLAMADAAVGGKTAVNLPAGKNLVGAFHQPRAVLADLDALASLPARELRSGLAEVLKAGLVGDPGLVELVDTTGRNAAAGDVDALAPLLAGAIRVKARVVAADELDADGRMTLNYGHTLGHALERLERYDGMRHGEAVALGMVFAACVAERVGVAEPGLADGHRASLRSLGLPWAGLEADPDAVLAAMGSDKKHRGGLRLVLLRAPGDPVVVPAPDRELLVEALGELRSAQP